MATWARRSSNTPVPLPIFHNVVSGTLTLTCSRPYSQTLTMMVLLLVASLVALKILVTTMSCSMHKRKPYMLYGTARQMPCMNFCQQLQGRAKFLCTDRQSFNCQLGRTATVHGRKNRNPLRSTEQCATLRCITHFIL